VGLFRDFLPVPPVCKSFFPVRSGYSLAQGCFDATFGSQRPFSPRCEATSFYTFLPDKTQDANNNGQTLQDLVNTLTNKLTAEGYKSQ
jgi:hypothetical protein